MIRWMNGISRLGDRGGMIAQLLLRGGDRHFEEMPRSFNGHDLDSEGFLASKNATAHHFHNGKYSANYGRSLQEIFQ